MRVFHTWNLYPLDFYLCIFITVQDLFVFECFDRITEEEEYCARNNKNAKIILAEYVKMTTLDGEIKMKKFVDTNVPELPTQRAVRYVNPRHRS